MLRDRRGWGGHGEPHGPWAYFKSVGKPWLSHVAKKSQVKRQPSHSQTQESSSQGSSPLSTPTSTLVCLGLSEADGPAPGSSWPHVPWTAPEGKGLTREWGPFSF